MYKARIRFKKEAQWISTVAAVVLLESLAERNRDVAALMNLDTVDDLIEAVITLLEDARNQRYLVERLEEE